MAGNFCVQFKGRTTSCLFSYMENFWPTVLMTSWEKEWIVGLTKLSCALEPAGAPLRQTNQAGCCSPYGSPVQGLSRPCSLRFYQTLTYTLGSRETARVIVLNIPLTFPT